MKYLIIPFIFVITSCSQNKTEKVKDEIIEVIQPSEWNAEQIELYNETAKFDLSKSMDLFCSTPAVNFDAGTPNTTTNDCNPLTLKEFYQFFSRKPRSDESLDNYFLYSSHDTHPANFDLITILKNKDNLDRELYLCSLSKEGKVLDIDRVAGYSHNPSLMGRRPAWKWIMNSTQITPLEYDFLIYEFAPNDDFNTAKPRNKKNHWGVETTNTGRITIDEYGNIEFEDKNTNETFIINQQSLKSFR
ncbi:MAG: hypothetical protein ACJA1C_003438 [Crocinitomicaceae bacterium]|jgi:hypothetical protein